MTPAAESQLLIEQGRYQDYRPWKHGLLRPDTHEPGIQRGYRGSGKHGGKPSSNHASKSSGKVSFWKVGTWAGGIIRH